MPVPPPPLPSGGVGRRAEPEAHRVEGPGRGGHDGLGPAIPASLARDAVENAFHIAPVSRPLSAVSSGSRPRRSAELLRDVPGDDLAAERRAFEDVEAAEGLRPGRAAVPRRDAAAPGSPVAEPEMTQIRGEAIEAAARTEEGVVSQTSASAGSQAAWKPQKRASRPR